MKTIIDEKRGRKSLSKTHDEDTAFVRSIPKYANVGLTNMTNTINRLRSKFLKALERNDIEIEDAANKSLAELDKVIKSNNIQLKTRAIYWNLHEKDIVAGINELFKSNFFKVYEKGNAEPKKLDEHAFYAQQIGGGLMSDVQVVHKRKSNESSFFVECKLNLQAAEYFKFGLEVDSSGNLKYDHSRFLEGAVKEDKAQLKAIDDLFNKKIDLNSFLRELVSKSDVKKFWKQLLDNLKRAKADLDKSDEYKQFSEQQKLKGTLPNDFQTLATIFDTYCKWYIQRYNQLIDEMFGLVADEEVRKRRNDFKIFLIGRSDNDRSAVVGTLNELVEMLVGDGTDDVVKKEDHTKIKDLAKQAKEIEIKLNVLLKHLGIKEGSFQKLSQLKDLNKAMYFYKLFVSTVGRKRAGKQELLDMQSDEFGNMCLVPDVELDDSKLPQMITDYYIEKDQCAYIQIDDTLLQFDEDFNPLDIPDLPIFKDAVHKFCVRILVSDDLSRISLHIRAMELDKKMLSGKNIVSLKKTDSNYIMKVLKNGIKVKV